MRAAGVLTHAGLHTGVYHLADTSIQEEYSKAATEKKLLKNNKENSEDMEEMACAEIFLEIVIEGKANGSSEKVHYPNDEEDKGGVEISNGVKVIVATIKSKNGSTDYYKDEAKACEHHSVL